MSATWDAITNWFAEVMSGFWGSYLWWFAVPAMVLLVIGLVIWALPGHRSDVADRLGGVAGFWLGTGLALGMAGWGVSILDSLEPGQRMKLVAGITLAGVGLYMVLCCVWWALGFLITGHQIRAPHELIQARQSSHRRPKTT